MQLHPRPVAVFVVGPRGGGGFVAPPANPRPPDAEAGTLRLLTVAILALGCFAVPLFFDTALFSQFYLPQALALELVAAAGIASALLWVGSPSAGPWRRVPVDRGLLLLVAWLVVRTVTSISPAVSWNGEYGNVDGARLQLACVALFVVAVQAVRRDAERAAIALALGLAGLVASTYVLLQAAGLDFVRADVTFAALGRFDGTSGNPIPAGAVIAVSLILLAALLTTPDPDERNRRVVAAGIALLGGSVFWLARFILAVKGLPLGSALRAALATPASWFLLAGIACAVSQLLLAAAGRGALARTVALVGVAAVELRALAETGSRSGWIGLAAGAALALTLALVDSARRERPWRIEPLRRHPLRLVLGSTALLVVLAAAAFGTASGERLVASLLHPGEALARSRSNIWVPAIAMWRARPIDGWGVDTFMRVFPAFETGYRPAEVAEQAVPQNAHSEPLTVLATLGAVGLLLWVGLLVIWIVAAVRALLIESRSSPWRLQLAGIAAVATILVYGLFGIPSIPLRMALWMLLALTLPSRPAPRPAPMRIPFTPRALAAGLVLALGLHQVGFAYFADRAYKEAFVAWSAVAQLEGMPPTASLQLASGALRALPATIEDPQLAAIASELRASEAAIARLLRGGAGDPRQVGAVVRRYASLALLLRAALAQQRAVSRRPAEPQYHWFLGEIHSRRYELFPEDERREEWFERARAAYARSLAISRRDAFGSASLGRLNFQRWLLERDAQALAEARRLYRSALDLAPLVRPFVRDAMSLESSAGQPGTALSIAEEVSRRAPSVGATVLVGHPLFETLCAGDRASVCRDIAVRARVDEPRSPAASAILERLGG